MFWVRVAVFAGVVGITAASQATDLQSAPTLPDQACDFPPQRFNFVEFSTPVFRQGAVIGLRPKRDNMPAGYLDVPASCTSDWSIAGPARLSSDHTALTIAEDAAPGSEVVLRFRVLDEVVLSRLTVVARDAVVLTGRWGQSTITGCDGLEPVRELEFGPARFSVTFAPFESYKDYWGSYDFDSSSGALRMTVQGGNAIPPSLDLEGVASFEGGHLVLDQFFLGDQRGRQSAASCRYTF